MTGYWVTEDGRLLSLEEMETPHLQNCIAMLTRKAAENDRLVAFYDTLNGELAREAAAEPVGHAAFLAFSQKAKRRELEAELDRRTKTMKRSR